MKKKERLKEWRKLRLLDKISILWFITLIILNVIVITSTQINFVFLSKIKNKFFKHDFETTLCYDENGIPMFDYGYKDNIFVGLQYSPLLISRKGMEYIEEYISTNSSISLKNATKLANWFIENKLNFMGPHWKNGTLMEYYIWVYDFVYPYFIYLYKDNTISKPFFGSLAQSHVIEFFERFFILTNNITYHNYAINAYNAFRINITDGGIIKYEDDGLIWIPEYIERNNPDNIRYVLNGCMIATQRLFIISALTNDVQLSNDASYLADEVTKNIVEKLPLYEYNNGNWSFYDRLKNKASESYHQIHINLAEWLYNRTGITKLSEYKIKWSSNNGYPFDVKWYIESFFIESKKYLFLTVIINVLFILVFIITFVIIKLVKNKIKKTQLKDCKL